jgi:hypothetical protein
MDNFVAEEIYRLHAALGLSVAITPVGFRSKKSIGNLISFE